MKNIYFSLILVVILITNVVGAKAQSAITDFVGNWMLNKEKTNTTKDFPQKLKNYKMSVQGNENNLNVRSQIDGTVEIQAAGSGSQTPITQSASRISSSQNNGTTVSTSVGKINYGGTMSLFFTPSDITYNLNGEEIKTETKQGPIRIKAKADKSGKSLQFVTIRKAKTPNGEIEVIIREIWKLSEDGKVLRLQRTVELPTVRDEITMILSKVG